MSKLYYKRPSEIVGIVDEYDSYCFDEACAYIISRIKDGEEPVFKKVDDDGNVVKPHYKSLRDMYNSIGYKYGESKKKI